MQGRTVLVAALLAAVQASAPASAAPAGASACSGCHAPAATAIPSLTGQSAADIVAAMRAYRAGERPASVMDRIAKGFSEEETAAVAAWLTRPGRRAGDAHE